MAEYVTVQQAVLGELLPDIGRKSRAGQKDQNLRPHADKPGSRKAGGGAGLIKNSVWVPQSVVKRVAAGGCHNAKELRRQMEYVMRDEANVASWSNQIGIERSFDEDGVDGVVGDWSSSWVGSPKRGHTDHIILSFPKGTDAETAEAVAREWGDELFASGYYDDRFRYVAALHHNTEHVHAHFIVDKVGMDHGNFLSINRFSEINYDSMRELHVEVAARHDLALNATSRLSRGMIENAPRDTDIQAAKKEGREPHVEPLSFIERARREAVMRGHIAQYRMIEDTAKMNLADDPDGFWNRVMNGAQVATGRLMEGQPIMNDFADVNDVPSGSVDPAGRLIAAREALMAEAQSTWNSIQEMEPSADKVELERQFAEHSRTTMQVMGEDDFLKSHVTSVADGNDPYSVDAIGGLAERARNPEHRLHAQADTALTDYRDSLEQAFSPFEKQFEERGTNAEEMAARFAASDRTEAQLEATRPDDPVERAEWMKIEQALQVEADKVAANLPTGRELQEDLAREQLLDARSSDRLADIAALDKLVTEVRADLADGDMDRIANGQLDPLMDQIRDPGVRQAVASEFRHIQEIEERRDGVVREIRDGVDAQFDGPSSEFTKFEPIIVNADRPDRDSYALAESFIQLAEERKNSGWSQEDRTRADAVLEHVSNRHGQEMRDALIRSPLEVDRNDPDRDRLQDEARAVGRDRAAVFDTVQRDIAENDAVHGRDSEPATTYRELVKGHERSAERANTRGRDREDHELEL